ncbi:MAG TPA: phosphoglucomutase/phosphomannomutase family protein [Thermomicrobiales bacterium]|nr:phosphoglucomutase/phosphomannomutase family protein [Thermomicrobiales bacterium]
MTVRFGTDGWRGVIAEDFTFGAVRRVSRALAEELRERVGGEGESPALVVGYDTRFGSAQFAAAAAEVLAAHDVHVYLCTAPVPSPAVSHAIVERGADGGIVITASHNPPAFNGLKVKGRSGAPASFTFLRAVEARLAAEPGDAEPVRLALDSAEDHGQLDRINPVPDYLASLGQLVDLDALRNAGLTVVADAMFGAGAGLLPKLFAESATKVIEINGSINPAFPGLRGPEPIAANLSRLSRVVADGDPSLGLAFDGDADRLGVVGAGGEYISAQTVFALLALYLLEVRGWSGPIIKSTNATAMLDRLAEDFGVPIYETPVGFTAMAPLMREHDAILAGEESGGFAFRHHFPDRDGLLAGLFLLDLLVRRNSDLATVIGALQQRVGDWFYERLDIPCPRERCGEVMARVQGASVKRLAGVPIAEVSDIAGQKYVLEDESWLLIRFSGTEPVLRLYAEAHTPERVKGLLARGRELAGV